MPEIPDGGWFALLVGAIIVTLLTTWPTGRRLVGERLERDHVPSSPACAP